MRAPRLRHRPIATIAGFSIVLAILGFSGTAAAQSSGSGGTIAPRASGGLDCNGYSTIQQMIKQMGICTDVRGFAGFENKNNDDGRFYDNGHYIGHDEPTLTFLSHKPNTGNNVAWTETLPKDPVAAPTVATPGTDVTHWFELSPAPWFGMALCDPGSYPQLPCTPNSDLNAPQGRYPGGGSAFLEVQFYPPGEGPFPDNISCDNTHWCASLHINELECTFGFASCNTACNETTNFAFIQRNGIPTGPPSPQLMDLATSTPNAQTLLMNPGDRLRVHIWDAPAPGVPAIYQEPGHALEVRITDLTTGRSGYMQASAANGYTSTDMVNCNGRLFNYEPEYNTASRANIVPWAAVGGDIMTEFEIGHFEPCTSVSDPVFDGSGGPADPIYNTCTGPYESASDSGTPEDGEAVCYPAGDTHGTLHSDPNLVTGCEENIFQNGDLDFDGTPYWPDWPVGTSATARKPGSFVQSAPVSNGKRYANSYFQTDVALSESACSEHPGSGCTVPPNGPGNFYPYFSTITKGKTCSIVFGNVAAGPGVDTYGQDAQYGHDQRAKYGYDEFFSKIENAVC